MATDSRERANLSSYLSRTSFFGNGPQRRRPVFHIIHPSASTQGAFAAPPSIGWAYNARGEVTSAANSDNAKSRFYDYDPIGNRKKSRTGTATDSGGNLTTYVSNSLNQYSSITPPSAIPIPQFDADGNQLTSPLPADPSKTAGYLWDSENRLLEASSDGTLVGSYRYDPFGRRIAKTASGTTTLFLYDGWNLIAEYSHSAPAPPSFALFRSHLWGKDLSDSMQGAGGVGGLLAMTDHGPSSVGSFYPLYDGSGNVGQYLEGSGAAVASYEYDPFGKVTLNTDSTNRFPIRFSTKWQDFETGLNYYVHRYYDSPLGRWVNRDPIGEVGGENLYNFVMSDAVNKIDLLGWLTEVITFSPVGKGKSSFGHTAVNINGTTYSFGEKGWHVEPTSDYMERNNFRDATGQELNLTPEQEAALEKGIKEDIKNNKEPWNPTNICGNQQQ